jgi:hypothetical protein
MVKEALDAIPKLTADAFKGSPIEAEYKKLSFDSGRVSELRQAAPRHGFERARHQRRQAQGHHSADVSSTAMPTACGSSTSRKCFA